MKYVIVKIGSNEVPMIFGNDVDLAQVKFPWPIVAAGVGVVQNMFLTCQMSQTLDGVEYGSRGLKDEILMRAADFTGEVNPQIGYADGQVPTELDPEYLVEVRESFDSQVEGKAGVVDGTPGVVEGKPGEVEGKA